MITKEDIIIFERCEFPNIYVQSNSGLYATAINNTVIYKHEDLNKVELFISEVQRMDLKPEQAIKLGKVDK